MLPCPRNSKPFPACVETVSCSVIMGDTIAASLARFSHFGPTMDLRKSIRACREMS